MLHRYSKLPILIAILLIPCAIAFWQTRPVWAGGVVGDGTPASCTGNAVEAALAGGGTVTFNCGPDPVTIASNTMVIGAGTDVTLDGAGVITLDGENLRQLFIVDTGARLTLNNLTLARGHWVGSGGAIANAGVLTLNNSIIRDSQAEGQGALGGGISNTPEGEVTLKRSQILNNTAFQAGGGIDNSGSMSIVESTLSGNAAATGGALYTHGATSRLVIEQSIFSANSATDSAGALLIADGETTLTNATVSGNRAGHLGGGIEAGVHQGLLSLESVTLFGNDAPVGANLYQLGSVRVAMVVPLTMHNSLLTNPVGGVNCALPTALLSNGFNLASDESCGLTATGDQQNVDPLLGALADNGGATQTHLPQPGRPAIDAGQDCPAIDQRGEPRPAGNGCDIGATEVQPEVPTETPTATPSATAIITETDTPTPTPTGLNQGTPVPVILNYTLPLSGFKPVAYPLSVAKLLDPLKLIELTKHPIDVDICLYRADPTAKLRTSYETIIQYFADAIYEMTNGAHIIRNVTFIYHCTDLGTDVVWSEQLWPNSTLSGYGNDSNAHVAMADTFTFPTPYPALQAGNERGAGYTLAHEWGHYMYGINDQYANTAVNAKGAPTAPCDSKQPYQGPCYSDKPVNPSVMTSQWNATGGDYTWLNFSISKDETKQNANWRLYQADAWTILTRSANNDPQAIYTNHIVLRRNYFSELANVAPKNNQRPTIELPTNDTDLPNGTARLLLKITWRDRNGSGDGLPQFKPHGNLFHGCLTCPERLNWENLVRYPDQARFQVQLEKQLPVARMQVVAQVTDPNGAITTVPLADKTGAGNYQAVLPYQMNGVHTVQFVFTNPENQAVFTNGGVTYTAGPNGEQPPLVSEPVNQPFTITASSLFTVTDVQPDDHADVQAQATVLKPTNEALPGHIDRTGDVDMFTFAADQPGTLVVRITELALGMQPHLVITRSDGSSVFSGSFDPAAAPYLFAQFQAAAGDRFYVAVTDANPAAQGGFYRISAGPPVDDQLEAPVNQIFLPLVNR